MSEKKEKPKKLKSHEGMVWDILQGEGKDYNEWKKQVITEQSLLFLQGKNKDLEELIIEQQCTKVIAEKLPSLIKRTAQRNN